MAERALGAGDGGTGFLTEDDSLRSRLRVIGGCRVKRRTVLLGTAVVLQGCLMSRSVSVRPSRGGGEYRFTFRSVRTGEPALGYGYSIETGQAALVSLLGTSFTGGPLDLHGSTQCTLEDDIQGIWSVRLEPPHPPRQLRREFSYSFDVNRVFHNSGRRWPQKFRLRDERTGRWELTAERIGPSRY